ncbi:UNVERIFIED_CONTAM: hypothetical protein FKN15_002728 [Acipenser sinensis]
MQGASEAGLASFPPVGAAFAALVKSPTLSGLVKDPTCPNKQCRTTEVHLKRGYSAATEAVRLSNLASLLSVYQAALVKDLPDYPSVSLRAELGLIAQLLVKLAQLNARAQGRSIASLVVARRQLWLSQARVQEHDKAPLLDAPITPGHTFGPAVEEMLQRSAKAREASRCNAQLKPKRHCSSWLQYGRVGLSRSNAHRNISGIEHHRSTSRVQGVLRPSRQVRQRVDKSHLGDRSAQGGALEEVADHALVALARPLVSERSLSSPEKPRQPLTHPYTVPQLLFWQQCTSDIQ